MAYPSHRCGFQTCYEQDIPSSTKKSQQDVGFKPFLTPATFAKSPKKWLKTQEMLKFPLSIHRGLSLLCNWCARFPPVAGKGGPTVNAFSWFWIGDVESKKQWWYQAISWHLFVFIIYLCYNQTWPEGVGGRERERYMQLNQLIWTNHELVRFLDIIHAANPRWADHRWRNLMGVTCR